VLSGKYGAVAAGHDITAQAAIDILEAGGNAFDAVIASTAAACIAEPVLASLGGGGFLTARPATAKPVVYDFFVQTPAQPVPHAECDFYPVIVDFGATQQEFHIGAGSIAVPGVAKGLFDVHRELGSMPMRDILAPAIQAARTGVEVNPLQAYLAKIVSPIHQATAEAQRLYAKAPDEAYVTGDTQRFERQADVLETLAHEGADLFYKGEIADAIAQQCRVGGHVQKADLENYTVVHREPHRLRVGDYEILTNPPPSSGGMLIGFALQLLHGQLGEEAFGSSNHLHRLVAAMDLTNKARVDCELRGDTLPACFARLDAVQLQAYRQAVLGRSAAMRGTTHISVADAAGNLASLTLSNGEGCGAIVPGCGFMLNNMLGEEDLNPGGFGRWQADQRMTSMMSPSVMRDFAQQREFVLGSGGSNRIRSAILQVLLNVIEFDLPVQYAVAASRLHIENNTLNIEKGFNRDVLATLLREYPEGKAWDEHNLFFGGVHTVMLKDSHFDGAGDFRRGGVYRVS